MAEQTTQTGGKAKPSPADERARQSRIRALIEEGLKATESEHQLRCFEAAHALDRNDPRAMSFHGMALASVRHRYLEGIVFCEEAVRRMGPNPDLLVNLARSYLAANNKREAVRALRRAMSRSGGDDVRARAELVALGLRRPPVIPFLPRGFFLNRWLGRLRHRLLMGRQKDDPHAPIPAELGQLSGSVEEAQRALGPATAAGAGAKGARDGLASDAVPEHKVPGLLEDER